MVVYMIILVIVLFIILGGGILFVREGSWLEKKYYKFSISDAFLIKTLGLALIGEAIIMSIITFLFPKNIQDEWGLRVCLTYIVLFFPITWITVKIIAYCKNKSLSLH